MLLAPTVLRKGSLLREGNEPYVKVQEIKMHRPNQNQINLRGNENPLNARSVLELGGNDKEDSTSTLLRKISGKKEEDLAYSSELTVVNDVTNSGILGRAMQEDVSLDSVLRIKRTSDIGVDDGTLLTSTSKGIASKSGMPTTMMKSEAMQYSIGQTQPSISVHRKILYVPTSFFTFDSLDGTEWNILAQVQIFRESELTLSLIFVLSSAICLAVGILLILHTYLVLSAQTTIEFFLSFPLRAKFKYGLLIVDVLTQ